MAAPTFSKMAAPALEQLLTELLEPDSAGIRQATERLREALEEPETLQGLAGLLREAERPQVRNLAALLLRKLLRKLPPDLIDRLPHLVVEALEQETDDSTQRSLAQLGARLLLLGGPKFWEPMEKWLQGAAREPQKMEAGLRALGVAGGVAGPALPLPPLLPLCRAGLAARGDPKTLGGALGALGGLLGAAKKSFWRSVVPEVLEALQELLDMDEDRGADALEVLDEFLEVHPESLIPHLKPMLELCLQVAGDECRGDAVRVRALGTLTLLAQTRPRALLKGSLLPLLLRGLLVPLCSPLRAGIPDPEENWDENEGGEGPCPRHAAAQVLDALAQGLPPEKLLKELLPLLEAPGRGRCPGGRKGALLGLAAVGGSCGGEVRRRYLGPVLGALRGGLGDPDGAVRGAAAAAVRELREELEPELSQVAAEALPRILGEFWESPNSPNSPNSDPKSWFVLETLLEALGEGVQPWLPQVLPRISGALESPQGQELGLSALHALACSCDSLSLPSPTLSSIIALAREGPHQFQALGLLAALGAQVGEGLLELLDLALGLAEGDSEGTRVSLQLLSAVSELLGEGTAPLLPRALPVLQGALRPPPRPPSDSPHWLLNLHDDDENDDVTAMEQDDVTDWEQAEVGGAFPGLAEAALGALGELAENCGSALLPYLDPLLAAILDLTQFPQCEVRGAAYEALGSLCCCGRGAQTGPSPAQQGAFQALLAALGAEPEVGGAVAAVGGVGRLLQGPGPAPRAWLQPMGEALCDVIAGKIACLRSRRDDGDETSQLSELRESASDWLLQLGAAMTGNDISGTGNDLTQTGNAAIFPPHLFRRILPSLLAHLADPAHPGARSWAGAVIGQLGHALGAGAAPFLPDLGGAFRLAVRDPEPEVRANAFYAIGRIGEAVGHARLEYPPSRGWLGLGHARFCQATPIRDKPRPFWLSNAHLVKPRPLGLNHALLKSTSIWVRPRPFWLSHAHSG